ncbi:hypothetical protein FRE64_05285 [Euhalothece natronophila Z-M001]|uniref:Uncharacterized protein n=1 Tax=Euhalothece natronophila Z-M001 TaxID=522448 RepID=A0A5B8NLI6_9CHRO|nr:hypothetical protein [Euhalothece natronophila]QDZ39391.1 hypothetical protein FRE64_05285 [Euhalothece natronophila Z-M001]
MFNKPPVIYARKLHLLKITIEGGSMIEVDVEQGLEHLKEVMANPNQYEVLGEVRAQAEVFTGLAEIMGLEGFGEIVDSTMKALETYPQEAVTIGRLMVRDLEAGRSAFLRGISHST